MPVFTLEGQPVFYRQEKDAHQGRRRRAAEGRAGQAIGCYSEKTGKTYDAAVVLDDDGGKYVNFRLEFDKGGKKT